MSARADPTNDDVANILDRIGDLLAAQHADNFRVRAYHQAAHTCRTDPEPIATRLHAEGTRGLEAMPTIGRSIASTIEEYVETGTVRLLERLEGQVAPEDLFTTVPGIGEALAKRLHDELGLDTLEELELAAHDGRLRTVQGVGHRREQAIRDLLATLLSRSSRRRARLVPLPTEVGTVERPGVDLLLSVDGEYRRLADADRLPRIAPRRFNPAGAAWLPIYHVERDGWSFTALYSNTARAHRLGTTHDWVILYFERDGHEAQATVVTEIHGPLTGQRVVRGRELECAQHYGQGAP